MNVDTEPLLCGEAITGTLGDMTVTIRRQKRRIDAGEIGISAVLFSVYASARGAAMAIGAARALLP